MDPQPHEAVPISTTAYLIVLGKDKIREFGTVIDIAPERGSAPGLTIDDLQRMFKARLGR